MVRLNAAAGPWVGRPGWAPASAGSRSTSQAQRPRDRRLAALAQDVLRASGRARAARSPGRRARPAGRRRRCSRDRSWPAPPRPSRGSTALDQPARAIAAAGEPDRVEGRARWRPRGTPRRAPRRRRRSGRTRGSTAGGRRSRAGVRIEPRRERLHPRRRPPATGARPGRRRRCAAARLLSGLGVHAIRLLSPHSPALGSGMIPDKSLFLLRRRRQRHDAAGADRPGARRPRSPAPTARSTRAATPPGSTSCARSGVALLPAGRLGR